MAWLDWMSSAWETSVSEDVRQGTLWHLEALRGKHGEDFARLLEVLSHSDPVGLLAVGAPPDEYVPEVRHIFVRLPEAESANDLQNLMHSVFVQMFDAKMAGPPSRYEEAAHAFWEHADGQHST